MGLGKSATILREMLISFLLLLLAALPSRSEVCICQGREVEAEGGDALLASASPVT